MTEELTEGTDQKLDEETVQVVKEMLFSDTIEQVKDEYVNGEIGEEELECKLELALIEEVSGPHHSMVASKEWAERVKNE